MQLKSRRTLLLCTLAALVTAAVFIPKDMYPFKSEANTSAPTTSQQLR
ncbi:hypothetical protein KO528_00560 [Saccharophagus degradans]|uniref:Uncharacterized protein n=1 Tax=Saccharophagus degradans TaxID=86304 RepID=A0AAW7X5M9_9GAMM|nr:hypothetical protein [Saccharophagus degradans]MBU2983827.1 hypothetical protein [Saccharophagus degradans]MDO6422198.1 hypothetical protein [Saccharophagus degradans]MDO6607527.1 hypothetical protein [Saccharophagus degradans]